MVGIACILALAVGYGIGLLQNGINIHHYDRPKQPEKQEYTESLTQYLDEDVQKYYQNTQGHNKF